MLKHLKKRYNWIKLHGCLYDSSKIHNYLKWISEGTSVYKIRGKIKTFSTIEQI